MKPTKKLEMKQIERRLIKLREVMTETRIRTGWVSYIRGAMSMSLAVLAKFSKLSTTTVYQIEQREKDGKVTLATMQKMAAAMDCEFVYAIVPKEELSTLLKKKAILKATRLIKKADVHMTLEDQRVKEAIENRIEQVAEDLLAKGDIW